MTKLVRHSSFTLDDPLFVYKVVRVKKDPKEGLERFFSLVAPPLRFPYLTPNGGYNLEYMFHVETKGNYPGIMTLPSIDHAFKLMTFHHLNVSSFDRKSAFFASYAVLGGWARGQVVLGFDESDEGNRVVFCAEYFKPVGLSKRAFQ